MTTYTATIRHHSISRARVITITGTLAQAKRAASKEFGGEMPDCTIRIEQAHDGYPSQPIANKRVGAARWSSYLNTPPQHHTPRSHTMSAITHATATVSTGANLSGATLTGVNLARADLTDAR